MSILDNINTIVLLMFENRSFDHMLGHLSLELGRNDIDGLKPPLDKYNNIFKGDNYPLYELAGDSNLPFDLPHEWNDIETQLSKHSVTKKFTMKGFVEAYSKVENVKINPESEPMGYFSSRHVPITSFLAQNFCTCNRWFSSLPTSTQPNRTIAFCGDTGIFETKTQLIDIEDSVFHWMDRNNIRWRVYHDGLSFFALYPKLWNYVLGDNFSDYENLYSDMMNNPSDTEPQVIIVEPSYYSSPHIGSDLPNDNHAPLAIGWGEKFLRRTYQAVTANITRWGHTVFIVYYDEHGGFYDHVPPPLVNYKTTGNPSHDFGSLGVRIPGLIISPFVNPGSVSNALFDHSSVLQLIAEKFTPGSSYSDSVNYRKALGINSLSEALLNDVYIAPPVAPSQPINVSSALGDTIHIQPTDAISQSFEKAAIEMISSRPTDVNNKYPELFLWKDAIEKARNT